MYFFISYLLSFATRNIFMFTLVTSIVGIRCSWTEFEIINQKISIDEKEINEPFKVEEGSNVNLTCQTSRAFEYCTWSHKDKECKFEWKQFSSQVEKQDDCTMDYNLSNSNSSHTFPRVSFKGDYHKYECTIQVVNITTEDEGTWKCEVESYVFGPFRGTVKTKTISMNVFQSQSKSKLFKNLENDLKKSIK